MILVDLLQKPCSGHLKYADIYFDAFALGQRQCVMRFVLFEGSSATLKSV
jgi:hypothetical protein